MSNVGIFFNLVRESIEPFLDSKQCITHVKEKLQNVFEWILIILIIVTFLLYSSHRWIRIFKISKPAEKLGLLPTQELLRFNSVQCPSDGACLVLGQNHLLRKLPDKEFYERNRSGTSKAASQNDVTQSNAFVYGHLFSAHKMVVSWKL